MRIRLNQRPASLIAFFFALILSAACPTTGYADADATERRGGDSVSVAVPPPRTIAEAYEANSEELGRLVGAEVVIRGFASYQVCAQGIVIAHGPVAFELHGPIYQKFLALSPTRHRPLAGPDDRNNADFLTERIRLIGFPTTDVLPFGIRGFFGLFEHAVIFYLREEAGDSFDPATGAFMVSGISYDKWSLVSSGLGAPHCDPLPTARDGLTYQHFDRGVIYQSGSGAFATFGDMYSYWATATRGLDNDPDFRSAAAVDPFSINWPGADREGNPTFGFPISDQTITGGSVRQEFERGTIIKRPLSLLGGRLRFFAQNTALLTIDYKGTERERSIQALIRHLRAEQYDVVGLSECFDDDERNRIWGELRTIYPYRLDGPDEEDFEEDGGLLLLSRYPITEHHQTIFRQCAGRRSIGIPWADCMANKGVLHARIQIPGFPAGAGYDVFLSHTQNPDEGGREAARATLSRQFSHLSSFIRAYSSPDRPAVLFGDLNTNALNHEINRELGTTVSDDMRRKLNFPRDVWSTGGGSGSGITFDSTRSFETSRARLAIGDPARHRSGQRIDYFLSWQGTRFVPRFDHSRVVVLQSSVDSAGRGHDISDHYGISSDIIGIQEFTVDVRRPITRVRVELVGFRCLEESDEIGSDSPYFTLNLVTARGGIRSLTTAPVDDIDTGGVHSYLGKVLEVPDPGDYLTITISGMEHDSGPFDRDDPLGNQSLRLSRSELLVLLGGSSSRVIPLLTGDGSGYAITARISVS